MAGALSVGSIDAHRAAAPATCGDAIEVPSYDAYELFGTVLVMATPGAPRSTVEAPNCENEASAPFRSVAATATTQSQPRVPPLVHS